MNKYGFWVVPDGEVYESLKAVITDLSKKMNAPAFSPHMTLHGVVESNDNEIVEKVKEAAKHISQFELELGPIEFSTTYFQCVFVRIKATAQLFNAHLELRKAFGISENHVFMPHASLLYSDMDMEEREKVAKSTRLQHHTFIAKEITIVRADQPDPETWEVVAVVPLPQQSHAP